MARDFWDGRAVRRVVQETDLDLHGGELTVLAGASGSGKTTLLSMIGLVLRPTTGRILFEDEDVTGLSDPALAALRLRRLGFVFQQPALIPGLSLLDNVLVALGVQGARVGREARNKCRDLVARLGLGGSEHMDPRKLSGGQKQRASIARALTLPSPLRFTGAWKQAAPLAGLTPDSLVARAGCTIVLRAREDGSFAGSTHERDCPSELRGAAYATSEVVLGAEGMVSWDRGFDAEGKQVWGATKGGYVFRRVAVKPRTP